MPLATEQAGVLENKLPVMVECLIKYQASPRFPNEPRKCRATYRKRLKPQVAAVQLQRVECAEMHVAALIAQSVEISQAVAGAYNGLAINQACAGLRALSASTMRGKLSQSNRGRSA
jgi:hypothetical protein